MNKLLSPADIIARLRSGMNLGIGGWGGRHKPMGLVREVLRSSLRDLTLVSSARMWVCCVLPARCGGWSLALCPWM